MGININKLANRIARGTRLPRGSDIIIQHATYQLKAVLNMHVLYKCNSKFLFFCSHQLALSRNCFIIFYLLSVIIVICAKRFYWVNIITLNIKRIYVVLLLKISNNNLERMGRESVLFMCVLSSVNYG